MIKITLNPKLTKTAFLFAALMAFGADTAAECTSPLPYGYGVNDSAHQYANSGKRSLDPNGVLVFDYGAAYDNFGKWHNPFFIARYAHALYRDWHKTNCTQDDLKEKFLIQARFLMDTHELRGPFAVWPYPFDNSYYGVPRGWISGIGQSQISGVLLRAHALTNERSMRDIGMKAAEPYLRPMAEGGVVTQSENGLWIQEVPSPSGKEFNILNGHITGLLGLLDVAQLTDDERLHRVVGASIRSVREHLNEFDAGFTSFYSLNVKDGDPPKLAPRKGYNNLHVWQLKKLHEITKDPAFLRAAKIFENYENQSDLRTSAGSTNDITHGPNEADARYGTRFWSHNVFPTWYQVTLENPAILDGIFISGYIPKATPKDFSVDVLIGSKWLPVFERQDNNDKELFLKFSQPTKIEAFRININGDNGNRNVALNAVMPIRSQSASVSNSGDIVSASPAPFFPGFRATID